MPAYTGRMTTLLKNWWLTLFGSRSSSTALNTASGEIEVSGGASVPFAIRYPPPEGGIPAVPLDEMMDTQTIILEKIRFLSGMRDDEFNQLYLDVIRGLAGYLHLLPASETHHHRGVGGLFRHTLEVSLFALQRANGTQLTETDDPSWRHISTPRWNYAAWLCGLFHDCGKPFSDVIVLSDKGDAWNPYLQDIFEWIEEGAITHYYIRWNRARQHEGHIDHNLFAYTKVTEELPRVLRYLTQTNENILSEISSVLLYRSRDFNPLLDIIKNADSTSVSEDRQKHASDVYGSVGTPVEWLIVEGLRDLFKTDTVNVWGQKVWLSHHGLHFVFPAAFEYVTRYLRQSGVSSVPVDATTQLDILADSGFIQLFRDDATLVNSKTAFIRILKDNQPPSKPFRVFTVKEPTTFSMDAPLVAPMTVEMAGTINNFLAVQPTTDSPAKEVSPEETKNEPVPESSITPDVQTSEAVPPKRGHTSGQTVKKAKSTGLTNHHTWLVKQGVAGTLLSIISKDITGRTLDYTLYKEEDGALLIRWPQISETYQQDAGVVISEMLQKGWVIKNRKTPDLPYVTRQGVNYIHLNPDISAKILQTAAPKDSHASKPARAEEKSGKEKAQQSFTFPQSDITPQYSTREIMAAIKQAIEAGDQTVIENTRKIGNNFAIRRTKIFRWFVLANKDASFASLQSIPIQETSEQGFVFLIGD